jgi:hypothetical protein
MQEIFNKETTDSGYKKCHTISRFYYNALCPIVECAWRNWILNIAAYNRVPLHRSDTEEM